MHHGVLVHFTHLLKIYYASSSVLDTGIQDTGLVHKETSERNRKDHQLEHRDEPRQTP